MDGTTCVLIVGNGLILLVAVFVLGWWRRRVLSLSREYPEFFKRKDRHG